MAQEATRGNSHQLCCFSEAGRNENHTRDSKKKKAFISYEWQTYFLQSCITQFYLCILCLNDNTELFYNEYNKKEAVLVTTFCKNWDSRACVSLQGAGVTDFADISSWIALKHETEMVHERCITFSTALENHTVLSQITPKNKGTLQDICFLQSPHTEMVSSQCCLAQSLIPLSC